MIRNYIECLKTFRTIIGTLCIFFCFNSAFAQIHKPYLGKWLFGLGFTTNSSAVVDKNFSLLSYNGNGLGASTIVGYRTKNVEHEVSFAYSSFLSKNKYQYQLDESYLTGSYTSFIYSYNFANEGFKILAGPNLSMVYDSRKYHDFVNNNNSFEFASSLGATLELRLGINKMIKGLTLNNRIALPLITYVEQPAYGSEGFFLKSDNDVLSLQNSKSFLGPQKFFRIVNTINMTKGFLEHHKIVLSYTLDYYKINDNRVVVKNNNSLGLLYCYIL